MNGFPGTGPERRAPCPDSCSPLGTRTTVPKASSREVDHLPRGCLWHRRSGTERRTGIWAWCPPLRAGPREPVHRPAPDDRRQPGPTPHTKRRIAQRPTNRAPPAARPGSCPAERRRRRVRLTGVVQEALEGELPCARETGPRECAGPEVDACGLVEERAAGQRRPQLFLFGDEEVGVQPGEDD